MTVKPPSDAEHQQWSQRLDCEAEPSAWRLIVRTLPVPAHLDENRRPMPDPDPIGHFQPVVYHPMGYVLKSFQPFTVQERYLDREMRKRFPDCEYQIEDSKLRKDATWGFALSAIVRVKQAVIPVFGRWIDYKAGGFYKGDG